MNRACFLSFFLMISLVAEKTLIITSAYNRPDFIEIQHKTFQKFLLDDYELVVFNDARDQRLKQEIEATCSRLNLECINIPQSIHDEPYLQRWPHEGFHDPAVRNANVVQYALHHKGFKHPGIVAIIDSDLFLVKPFSIQEYMQGYDLAGVPQSRHKDSLIVDYLWIGIAFLDMNRLPDKESINFNCGKIYDIPVDAGGHTHVYLNNHRDLSLRLFAPLYSGDVACHTCSSLRIPCPFEHQEVIFESYGIDKPMLQALRSGLQNVEFFLSGTFFHYRSGTNWDHRSQDFHNTKTRLFEEYLKAILKE